MAIVPVRMESGGLEEEDFQDCATGGDSFQNDSRTVAWFHHEGGVSMVVTFVGRRTDSHGFLNDHQMAVEPGEYKKSLMLDASRFNDEFGRATMTYSVNPPTGLKVACVRQESVFG